MRTALAALAIVVAASGANATAMLCKNPSREYAASYSEDSERFLADDTEYKVRKVENDARRYIVSGDTVNDGPSFRAQFRPRKQIQFFVDGKIFQTDRCR